MDKNTVIKLRKLFDDKHLVVYGDNMIITQDNCNGCTIWDDTNEIYYTIDSNRHPDYKVQKEKPITVMASTYDNIQYILSSMGKDNFRKLLNKLVSQGTINSAKSEEILREFMSNGILK